MDNIKEYILSQEELKKMQRIQFSMLQEVDRICRKYNILYSLDGGTLLGAIRLPARSGAAWRIHSVGR